MNRGSTESFQLVTERFARVIPDLLIIMSVVQEVIADTASEPLENAASLHSLHQTSGVSQQADTIVNNFT